MLMTGSPQPTGLDAASLPDPEYAVAHGIQVVAGYIGLQSWKSASPAYIRQLHAAGGGFIGLYEDIATNALKGAAQGAVDGAHAQACYEALYAGVGYRPDYPTSVIFAVDFDTNPAQYPQIDAYLRAAAAKITGHTEGDYGEADLIDHESAICHVGFGTYAWSKGRVSSHADLQQYLNGQKYAGTTVDFDQVIHLDKLGVWWPPGYQLESGSEHPIQQQPSPSKDDDDMAKNFHVTTADDKGNKITYIVANDLSSKTRIATANDEQNFQAMIAAQIYEERAMTPQQIALIPGAS